MERLPLAKNLALKKVQANDKHNPPRGCGENPFASGLPESAVLRRWHARKRGRVDAMLACTI